jgi:hypothetical protein
MAVKARKKASAAATAQDAFDVEVNRLVDLLLEELKPKIQILASQAGILAIQSLGRESTNGEK